MELLDLIDRLEELVETGTHVPWTGKSLVDAESVAEVIDRMRAA
ncbi:MAG: ATPase, partial [Chloroflexi bacterium]|nr:ATPase [Chloroflexota bacterium]